jgi:predicted  nucleic acid-binding Zn-ribbon protein
MSQYALEGPRTDASSNEDQTSVRAELDRSGNAILYLVKQAADRAEADGERARDRARDLSDEIVAAENRVAQLELEVQAFRDRAFSAEKWLLRIYKEIEGRFFNQVADTQASDSRREQSTR